MSKMVSRIAVACVVSMAPLCASAEYHKSDKAKQATPAEIDRASINAVVLDYFHGQGEASLERLNRAFAVNEAVMVGVMRAEDGAESLRAWKDMNEVLGNWAANSNPPGGERDGEILDMHITDGRIATVTFRSADRFYDALTLVKIDGDWKIAAKVFVRQ